MWSVWGNCVSLISLGFLDYVEHWDFVGNPCGIPLDRAASLHSRSNIKYISSTRACAILILAISFLLIPWELLHLILLQHWLLEVVTWNTSHYTINFHFWSPCQLISWFNKDWHLEMCDSSYLAWFLGLNILLSFSITSGTSTPILSLAFSSTMHGLLWPSPY
jgi:hypothetical protein